MREAKFEVKFGCFCGASFLGLFFFEDFGRSRPCAAINLSRYGKGALFCANLSALLAVLALITRRVFDLNSKLK